MEMYYLEDYSLGEISELFEVSRQAVYDNIRRTEKMLESYEQKLKLYDKFQQRVNILAQLNEVTANDSNMQKFINQLKELD